MRRKIVLFSVLSLMMALSMSCKKRTAEEGAKVSFKPYGMEEKHYLKNDKKNTLLNISLKLEFPVDFPKKDVLIKIQKAVLTDFFPDIDRSISDPQIAMEAYVKEYKTFFEDSEKSTLDEDNSIIDGSPKYEWTDNEKLIIRHNAENILSYTVKIDRFSGGAHGGVSYLNTVIDLKTGERITEEDLFTEDTRPLITAIILKKIMEKHQVTKVEDLEQIGYFDVAEIGLNNNFYLTNEGLVYTYNEYEIACYALGTTEVLLNFNDISGLLIPGNPIEKFIP